MSSLFARGKKLYAKIQDVHDRWQQVATGLSVGQEAEAEQWIAERERKARTMRANVGHHVGAHTVRSYAEHWLARRKTKTVRDDVTRLRKHVYPLLGDLLLADVRPRHARDLVMALRAAGALSPKTIRQVTGLLHTMFKSAKIEELVATNPIEFERGVLPAKVDADPTWRHEAIYERAELEQVIADQRLLADRRVLYGLKSLGALRHGEAARLTWAQYLADEVPLGAINLGETKAGVPRRIPAHPTLAAILADWWRFGWKATYGRAPELTDFVVPTRRFRPRAAAESQKQLIADLELLGLRTKAGKKRRRRGHDLRRAFITIARADGAIDSWLRWITHGPKANEMLDVYSSPPWGVLCAEMAKVQLGAALVQSLKAKQLLMVGERPQRDSNALLQLPETTGDQSDQALAPSNLSLNATAWAPTAPGFGAAIRAMWTLEAVDVGDRVTHGLALQVFVRSLRAEIVSAAILQRGCSSPRVFTPDQT